MTADRAALVRLTWAVAAAHPAAFAAHFHARLLARDPSLGLLVVDADLAERERVLIRVIDVAVRHLERLAPAGRASGAADPPTAVHQALLDALAHVLGASRWTPAVEAAWAEALAAMVGGLRVPAPAGPVLAAA